ncbi:Protein F13D2.1 b, partial [Aphelenchoides avenae]
LKNGVWYGFVDVTRCVEGQLDAPPKIKLIAEVHEQGTFQPGVASVEWDFLQPGFQLIPTRPAFTSDTPKIYLYVNPISAVHSITDGAVNVVAHCVSDDKQVNGMNRSFSNQRIGVFFELDVDPRCILYKIRARRALTPSLFSRDELLVIPRTNVDFLKFSTIVPADSLSYIYEEDDTFEARIAGAEVNYLVLCESRDFVASGWSSRKKIEFRITSNMNGQCILFTYTSDGSKFKTDMWLFHVPGHSCPDEFSLLLSSANITVAGKVTMALRGLPNSLATVQAIDSRLEGLISQSLESPKAHLWNFGIFASPDKSLDRFSWLSKLVHSAKFLANVGETCRQAAQHSSECPPAFQSSASLVSDLCLAEVVQNCPRNRGNGLLLEEARGGALRAPPAQVHVAGYLWGAAKPKANKQTTNYLNEMLANMQNDDTFYSTQP